MGLFLFLCVVALWVAAGGVTVGAQEPAVPSEAPTGTDLQVRQMRIQVMPEFDDPRVLVIVQGRLVMPGADLSLPITFRLPRGAQINQMATLNMSTGGTNPQPYEVQSDPDDPRWLLVTYNLDNPHFFYEYYDDSLAGDLKKHFTFTFSSLQPVDELLLEVQQPREATDFGLDPAPTSLHLDQALSMAYHQIRVGTLAAGQEVSVGVSYTKVNPAPSMAQEKPLPQPAESRVSARPAFNSAKLQKESVLGWVFVLLANAVLVTAGAYVWHRRRMVRMGVAPVLTGEGAPFCPRCGTAFKAGASFCHYCGASIKAALEQRSRVRVRSS